jgi:hypothetical protein
MNPAEIAAAIDRCAALSMRLHMIGDARSEKDLGLAVARHAGVVCLSSTKMPDALFTRALGFGTVADATQRTVDAVVRHYASLGLPVRFEVLSPAIGRASVRLLERNGFRLEPRHYQVHVLEPRWRPRAVDVPDLRIAGVPRADAAVRACRLGGV